MDDVNKNTTNRIKYSTLKRDASKYKNLIILETDPCLEYWFLLHFVENSTRFYQNCTEVIRELKRHIPNYEKTNTYLKKLVSDLKSKGDLSRARVNAERIIQYLDTHSEVQSSYSEIFKLFDSPYLATY